MHALVTMIQITNVQVERFSIPLGDAPLLVTTGSRTLTFLNREGAYLRLAAEDSNVSGIGEIVEPVFTGTTNDDPSQILHAALDHVRLCRCLIGQLIDMSRWDFAIRALIDMVIPMETWNHALVIARFGLEQALLTLASNAMQQPLHRTLRSWVFGEGFERAAPSHVLVNSLYNMRGGVSHSVVPDACVKIKVAAEPACPAIDAKLVNRVAQSSRSRSWIRLDANQRWSLEQASEFARSLSDHALAAIDYLEEPVNVSIIEDFAQMLQQLDFSSSNASRITYAIDEALLFDGAVAFAEANTNLRVIHKTFLHGIRDSPVLKSCASRITITTTFETGIGLSFLAHLAAAVNPTSYHGIHALPSMIHADKETQRVNSRVSKAGIHLS